METQEATRPVLSLETRVYLSAIGTLGGKATAGISTPKKRRAARVNIRKALDAKKANASER